jgi:vitamin B12 transporter
LTLVAAGAASVSLTLLASQAFAQSTESGSTSTNLDEVVVTASRAEQPAMQALEPVIVIDHEVLETAQAVDIGDVLRSYPGLDIGRNGGPGQPLSLFIRGANSNQSIVMIDGIRINSGTQALAPLMNVAPELFDRVEVVEGPRSTIYGTDAIGGVVNLITPSKVTDHLSGMLGYGRYNTEQFVTGGGHNFGDTGVQGVISGLRTNGYPPFAGDTLDGAYSNVSGIASVTQKLGSFDVRAEYWRAGGVTHYSNPLYNDDFTAITGFSPATERFDNNLIALQADGDVGIWHTKLSVSRFVDDLRQEQTGDFDHTTRGSVDWQNDLHLDLTGLKQTVTVGAIIADDRTRTSSFGTGYDIDTHYQQYYLQDRLEHEGSHLLLALGDAHYPEFGNHATYNVEFGQQILDNVMLVASAASAFRAPDATDRFGFGGNPALLPESSHNYELGLKARIFGNQDLSVAAFQNTVTDLIEFVFDPTNTVTFGENRNVKRARIKGAEATWAIHQDSWSAQLRGSVQDPRDLDGDTTLLRRTRHSLDFQGSKEFAHQVTVGTDLLLAGSRQDVDVVFGAPTTDGGYLLAGFFGHWNFLPSWTLSLRLDNAFDKRYQLANGYNTAGRSASIAIRYRTPSQP